MQKLVLLFVFFFFNITLADSSVRLENVVVLPILEGQQKHFDVSVYVSESSSWSEKEVLARMAEANLVFNSCKLGINKVYIFAWKPMAPLIRVDDYVSNLDHIDGMQQASADSMKLTSIQLFYFEDYLESFSSGASLPLAIYSHTDLAPVAFNTAWFPYRSYQRLKKPTKIYNEEAHEIGHILLESGHDHSGASNILANDSNLRTPRFSSAQCTQIMDRVL